VAHLEQELLPAPVFRLLEETAAFYQLQLHAIPKLQTIWNVAECTIPL